MSSLQSLAREVRASARTLGHEAAPLGSGVVEVSGVLAEQLVRELGAGARPASVRVGGDSPSGAAEVLVRVIAGEPTSADGAYVRRADADGTPVVLVQLWPQADWTRPFVLTPFVVECRAGQGFPLDEIARAIVDSIDPGSTLAASVPTIGPAFERRVVTRSVARVAALGALRSGTPSRPLITLEQLRMVGRLAGGRSAQPGGGLVSEPSSLGAVVGAVIATGFALRTVARTARFVVPSPLANAAVAASGTWALAQAAKAYAARASS
jgi:hypothetical protein